MRYGCVTISCVGAIGHCIQGETPLAALNKIQKTAYTLNPFVVGVAKTLMDKGIEVGKFIPIVEIPTACKACRYRH